MFCLGWGVDDHTHDHVYETVQVMASCLAADLNMDTEHWRPGLVRIYSNVSHALYAEMLR